MSRKKLLLLVVIAVLTLFGFVLGHVAAAAVDGPGTQADPLVTKSYVDSEVGKLQTQIDSLKADIEKLKSR